MNIRRHTPSEIFGDVLSVLAIALLVLSIAALLGLLPLVSA